jgi:excinuclease ABC subunit A
MTSLGELGTVLAAHWYGVRHFFEWLESKAYKMHIRVLLSRYRAYTPCPACGGARLKPEALAVAARLARGCRCGARPGAARARAVSDGAATTLGALPGLTIHDLMLLPIERARILRRRCICPRRWTRPPICC